jgi:D-tyrosyl-tRNA(Tyr) deacylase
MRVVIQRVKSSQVQVADVVVGKIGQGLNLLVGIADTDTEAELDWMTRKCLDLRLFPGSDISTDRWEKSVLEIGGELLVISQFTLYGDCRKGRRPSFTRSASPESAQQLYDKFVDKLRQSGLRVETGQFGAKMQVSIENDGPVTLLLEREKTNVKIVSGE